jgi:trimethylamine:corrinoid methyltransferase-like protein
MAEGITPREDFPSLPIFQELIEEGHLLISKHTRKYIKDELSFPGDIINRSNLSRWKAEGGKTLQERARTEVKRLIDESEPVDLTEEKRNSLKKTMENTSRNCGMDKLPKIEI